MASGVVWIERERILVIGWRKGASAMISGAAKVNVRVVEQRHGRLKIV